ncbi:hypothetical protein BU25DRAFT_460685 [Macroventuria anomochaeta]|uniref:Uncharacterized protein n=1 Tax=Macroventuria anomochaeta TaxID=301207 RepID=A0ACB6RS86_9PLEO|nr:uncharacterized protein BU25DRAFT_460685 [Macroventuria anomochaeta]KAF2624840.1 hypothetical protein BU25DRAFT_460685 [Macroventuria anomochaeta]
MAPAAAPPTLTAMRPHQKKKAKSDERLTWQQQEDLGTKNVGESNLQCLVTCFTFGSTPLPPTPLRSKPDLLYLVIVRAHFYSPSSSLLLIAHTDSQQQSQRRRRSRKAPRFLPLDREAATNATGSYSNRPRPSHSAARYSDSQHPTESTQQGTYLSFTSAQQTIYADQHSTSTTRSRQYL